MKVKELMKAVYSQDEVEIFLQVGDEQFENLYYGIVKSIPEELKEKEVFIISPVGDGKLDVQIL